MLLGWGDQFVPSSLKGSTIAVLFELKNAADEFLGYEWSTGKIRKVRRRSSDSHVIVESKFADGKRDTDLTGTTHGEKWVILETKHGAPKTSKRAGAEGA